MPMLKPRPSVDHGPEFSTQRVNVFGSFSRRQGFKGPIQSLADCMEWVLRVAKSVENEFWLPFALRGAIYEGSSALCRLAESGALTRAKAIDIVGQLEVCCLFYEDLFARSKTLNLISQLARRVGAEKEWSFSV